MTCVKFKDENSRALPESYIENVSELYRVWHTKEECHGMGLEKLSKLGIDWPNKCKPLWLNKNRDREQGVEYHP